MATLVAAPPRRPTLPSGRLRVTPWALPPMVFAVVNAIAFFVIRPDVNDLWAARARASAVSQGVGLFYWFGWFGGGSTPGNYSVITPYLCSWIGTELVGSLAAVATTLLVVVLVRGTAHPGLASALGAVGVAINLWSGRVPFLLGAVFAVAAVIAVRRGDRLATVVLTVLSVLASPVSGAFVAVGLSGTFLCTRTKAFRPIIAYAVLAAVVSIGLVALAFGAPGPEPFSMYLLAQMIVLLVVVRLARPPDHLRVMIWVAVLACVVLALIPNGMGSNFARFVWFCVPVAVAALGTARRPLIVLGTVPLVLVGSIGTVHDLVDADQPMSSVGYYTSLAHRLDRIKGLENYRVEVVNHGAHAGYDALLSHASLARGWETQEDNALNSSLSENPLPPATYKIWLDNNAVGYVALPAGRVGGYSEYALVAGRTAPYLTRIWHNDDWQLFRVADPTPIVAAPAHIVAHTQSSMTIDVPCVCTLNVRVRWSKFLSAREVLPTSATPAQRAAAAKVRTGVTDDGTGWTTVTTTAPGRYQLHGSARGLLR